MVAVADVVRYLDDFAPRSLAAEWDNVGLLLGDPQAPVERLLTCLTITPEVVAEAVAEKVQLIVSHHPILFRGVKRLTLTDADGSLLLPLVQAGVAVYSPHTAFDNCRGGINDWLCARLEITEPRPLRPRPCGEPHYKLVVFVPDSDLARVSDALFAAGAGIIGQYRECSFRVAGKGTFFGTESTQPAVGQKGRREEVDEWRLEVLVPASNLAAAVTAMRQAHSYEEPAFDIYPLHRPAEQGEGRIGRLAAAMPLEALARRVGERLGSTAVAFVGPPERLVQRVAVACGAAGEYLTDAQRHGADVFLTGEVRFHEALAARAAGVALIVAGHYATERPGVEMLAERLAARFPTLQVWPSRNECDPFRQVERGRPTA